MPGYPRLTFNLYGVLMNEITYSDQQGSRDRRAFLVLRDAHGVLHAFKSESLTGVCAVKATKYTKNGKWSHTIFTLAWPRASRPFRAVTGGKMGRCERPSRPTADSTQPRSGVSA